MTKKEASEKVAKLMKLANGSNNIHEASNAKAQAERLINEYGLSDSDLLSGEMAAAFDDLVDSVHKVVASHPALPPGLFNSSAIITDILHKFKNIGDADKATRLRQITTIVRTSAFIAGDTPIIAEIKAVLDSTLKNHGLSI
jgi:carboxylesterase type B